MPSESTSHGFSQQQPSAQDIERFCSNWGQLSGSEKEQYRDQYERYCRDEPVFGQPVAPEPQTTIMQPAERQQPSSQQQQPQEPQQPQQPGTPEEPEPVARCIEGGGTPQECSEEHYGGEDDDEGDSLGYGLMDVHPFGAMLAAMCRQAGGIGPCGDPAPVYSAPVDAPVTEKVPR